MQAAFELQDAIEAYLDKFMEFRGYRDATALRAFADAFRALDEVQRCRWPELEHEIRGVGRAARVLVHEWLVDEESPRAYAVHESALVGLVEGLERVLCDSGAGGRVPAACVH